MHRRGVQPRRTSTDLGRHVRHCHTPARNSEPKLAPRSSSELRLGPQHCFPRHQETERGQEGRHHSAELVGVVVATHPDLRRRY